MSDAKTITIQGKDVLKLKRIGGKKTDINGDPYWVFSHKSRGFTAREDFVAAFNEGNVYELDLTESTYTKTLEDGTTEEVDSWSEDGFLTYSQMVGVTRNEKELEAVASSEPVKTEKPVGLPS